MNHVDRIGNLPPSIPSTQVRRKTRPTRDSNREQRQKNPKDSPADEPDDGRRHIDDLA